MARFLGVPLLLVLLQGGTPVVGLAAQSPLSSYWPSVMKVMMMMMMMMMIKVPMVKLLWK